MNIAPTLIIVRVGLGRCGVVESIQLGLVLLGSHVVVLVIIWVFSASSHPAASPVGSSPTPRVLGPLQRSSEDTTASEDGRKVFPRARRTSLSTFEIQAPGTSAIIDIRTTWEGENASLPGQEKQDYELHASSRGPSGTRGFDAEMP
ncbi:hypothetical protein B0H11DRAFT_1921858 [Mycena galericulata]|nr:hypothetical protein B0H11DRAFT_1921858 [Mycena galericulata]